VGKIASQDFGSPGTKIRVSSIAIRLKNKPTDYQSFKIALKSKFIKSHIT